MKKFSVVVHGLITVLLALLLGGYWFAMVLWGDAPWSSWYRSFDFLSMYIDLYALLLITVFALPGLVFCGLHTVARLRGNTPRPGIRWTSNVFVVMFLCAVLIVGARFQVWRGLPGASERPKPALPSDGQLDFPELPLAPESAFAWAVTDLAGNTLEVADLQGKTLFINIWATWCGWCILEFPNLENLYEAFKDNEDVVFLLVSDEDAETIQAWRKGDGAEYDLPFYRTEVEFPDRYAPSSYPSTFIVGPDGRTVFRHGGAVQWDGGETQAFLTALSTGAPYTAPEEE
jgi:thiol-disulfide isomerase/thioredoxin